MKKLEEFVSTVSMLKEAGINFTTEQALRILSQIKKLADEAKKNQEEVEEQLGRIVEAVAASKLEKKDATVELYKDLFEV